MTSCPTCPNGWNKSHARTPPGVVLLGSGPQVADELASDVVGIVASTREAGDTAIFDNLFMHRQTIPSVWLNNAMR